jgi:hypothetical protein
MMSDINIDQLIEVLPRLIRENDRIKGAIISALAGVVATKEDIALMIQEMDKRFEANQAETNKRFEANQAETNKRFEANQAETNKRFEAIEKKFDGRFDEMLGILNNIQTQIGKPFEQFGRNVVSRILEGEGFPQVNLSSIKLSDPSHYVHEATTEIEIDGYSENPPIIVEITSILREKNKIEKFIRKKEFLEQQKQLKFRGFFVAGGCELNQEVKAELIILLKQNNCELINL